jgi:hypothetical protein
MEKKSTTHTPVTEENVLSNPKTHLDFLERKIDTDLGYYFWKKYIAAAFWSQVSTPLNLSITLLTAITTAQTNSGGFLSLTAARDISIVTLLLTVLNTFFTPLDQLNKNLVIVKKWNNLGTQFEQIYYDLKKHEHTDQFLAKYKDLQNDMNKLRENEGPETINFVTDLIHTISVCSCLRGYDKWLSNDRVLMQRKIDELSGRLGFSPCCDKGGCCNPEENIDTTAHIPPSTGTQTNEPGETEHMAKEPEEEEEDSAEETENITKEPEAEDDSPV